MEVIKEDNSILNIAVIGPLDSGKCTLVKKMNILSGNIGNPNKVNIKDGIFNLLPIPCHSLDYDEKMEMSSCLSDIVLITYDINLINDEENKFAKEYCDMLFEFWIKGAGVFILIANKMDKLNKDTSNILIKFVQELENKRFYNIFNEKINIQSISVSGKLSLNHFSFKRRKYK